MPDDQMGKLKRKCWESLGWVRGEQLRVKEGNQSHAFLARRKTDPEDAFDYILKTLKRQDSRERRALFFNETSVMSGLEHSGVLAVEETNAGDFKEQVELFLITRKVSGDDLEELVSKGLDLEDATLIVLGVLDILKHCHVRGVVHRDVKPCHVITCSGQFGSPILIDFGIAHTEAEKPTDAATGPGQGKGNRFLIGPEHLPGSNIANRSGATDISQCVGLLFYGITGRHPGILQDENGFKPHKRPGAALGSDIVRWKRDILNVIFDKAFEWHPDKRWNDIDALSQKLQQLTQDSLSPDDKLRLSVAEAIQESQIETKVALKEKAASFAQQFFGIAKKVVETIGEGSQAYLIVSWGRSRGGGFGGGVFGGGGGGFGTDSPASRGVLSQEIISFRPKHVQSGPGGPGGLDISIVAHLENSTFVAELSPFTGASAIFPDHQPIELGRCELGESEHFDEFRAQLEKKLVVCVSEMLSK